MGLIDYITKALRREQTEQDRAYTAATIRTSDELSNVRVSQNPKDFARVGRCLQGSVYNAATIVAKAASNGELRLYKKANGMNRSTKSKKVDRKTAAFLCGNNREIRPHNKAVMMAREAEEIQQVTEHEVLDLLRDPDPNTTQSDFMMMLYWYREVTGKAYVWVGGEKPVGLFLLHPQYTHPILKKESGIESYMYGRDNLSPIVIPSSEVLMTRYMIDPFSPWDGVSWVHSIEHYADVENAAVVSEVARWRNSGQYGMILKAPQSYNDVQLKQLEASLRGKGGPLAAGRALIVRDLEVVEAGNKPNEMNYLSGVEQAERAIYRAAGVPEALWKLNDANLASAAAADPFWQRNVYDRQQKVAQDLTEWLLPMFGIERGEMWFAYDNPVLDDVEMETKKMETAFKNGAVYLNEYRKAIGLDPLPDEMNTLGPKQAEQQAAPAEQSSQDQATSQKQPGNQAALSGIKVAELIRLANAVASGVVPEQTAELIARASFPNIPPEQIDQIFSKIQEGDATEIDPDVLLNQQEPIESEQSVGSTKSQTERRPPKAAQAEARRALEWRKEHNRGGTAVGVARARDIANGANLSDSTIMRMVSYFARHEVDKQGQGWSPGEEGYPSAGRIAWGLWGGDAGRTFANAEAERIKRNRKSMDERFAQKDCGTGAGGFKEGNTCATGSSGESTKKPKKKPKAKYASMQEAINDAPDGQSKAWLKATQELYDNDPQFKAFADGVALYTQGDYDLIREQSEDPKYADSTLGESRSPIADFKNFYDGQNIEESTVLVKDARNAIMDAINASNPMTEIHRGLKASEYGNQKLLKYLSELDVGEEIDFKHPTSFTTDYSVAGRFALGTTQAQGGGEAGDGVTITIRNARAVSVAPLSPYKQKEALSTGRFKIVSIDGIKPKLLYPASQDFPHDQYGWSFNRTVPGVKMRITLEPVS